MMRGAQGQWFKSIHSRFNSTLQTFFLLRLLDAVRRTSSLKTTLRALLLIIMTAASGTLRADIQYVYDGAGRLVEVIALDGSIAQYQYDGAGNITAIKRLAAGSLSIASFTPGGGPVGSTVTIYGSGFNTTANQNTVKFNGAGTTVTSATSTSLVVAVPSGATTGAISVSNSSGSVTSSSIFTVTTPLSITSFTPTTGVAGTSVLVSGTGFDLVPANNKVQFNGVYATVATASATQLQTTVPNKAGTGPIGVATATAAAISSSDFIVPPGTIASGDIISATRLPADAAIQVINFSSANKYQLILIDGGTANLFSAQFSSLSLSGSTSLSYTLFAPDNTTVQSGAVTSTNLSIHLPLLSRLGKYTLAITGGSGTGSVGVRLETNVMLVNGGSANSAISVSGQSKRYSFSGVLNQGIGIGFTDLVLTPTSSTYANYTVYKPDGTALTSGYCYTSASNGNGRCGINVLISLPGLYSVVLQPYAGATATFKVWSSPDKTGALTLGSNAALTFTNPGGSARYTFNATAGDPLGLGLTNLVLSPTTTTYADYYIYRPDGTQWLTNYCTTSGDYCSSNMTIPATGQYTVVVTPRFAATGSASLIVSRDKTGTLTTSTPVTLTLGNPGQNATYTYSGTAGQYLTLTFGNVTTNPSGQQMQVLMYKPDGTQYQSLMSTTGASVGMSLPETGTYTVFMQPYYAGKGAATGGATVVLDSGTAVSSGAAIDGTITVSGMAATFVANGTAGQGLGWGITNLTLTPSSSTYATYTVYKPDGTTATTGYCYTSAGNGSGSCSVDILAQTSGQYRLVLQPYGAATATFKVWANPDKTGALTLGSASSLSFVYSGQSARYTFNATAGDLLGLGLSNLTLSPTTTTYADYTVYKPDGTQWFTNYCTTSGDYCSSNMTIPAAGQYTVLVTPRYAGIGSVNLTISKDKTGTLTSNTAVTLTLDVPGQNATYTYSGTAGQYVTLGFGSVATNPSGQQMQVLMYKPDGTQYQSLMSTTGASVGMTLPVTGTYTVFMQPYYAGKGAATGSAVVVIDGGAAVSNGAATDGAITVSGMSATYVTNGTAGQGLNWAITNLTLTPSSSTYATYTVYKPDGTVAATGYCYTSAGNGNGSCNVNVLAQTSGQYRFVLQPYGGATATFKVWSNPDKTGALTLGSSSALTFTNPGESARYTFSATVGDLLGLGLTNLVLSPTTTTYADYTVYKPDGTQWFTNYCTTSGDYCSNNMTIPTTGQYTVLVTPRYAATGSVNLIVSRDKTGTLATNTPVALTFDNPGQNATYTYSGTAGQYLTLAFGNVATNPSGQQMQVLMYKPDGTQYQSIMSTTGASVGMLLPDTGTYTVFAQPYFAGKGAATGSTTVVLSSGTAVSNSAAIDGAITVSGMGATFVATGTAGQGLGWGITNLILTPSSSTYATYTVYKPDGTVAATGYCYTTAGNGNGSCNVNVLAQTTGQYRLVLQPYGAATATFKVWVNPDKTGALTLGSASPFSFTYAGQSARYTFNATAGDRLGLGLSNLVLSPTTTTHADYYVYRPDGTQWFTNYCSTTGDYCSSNMTIPTTGQYTVLVTPRYAATGSVNLTISRDKAGALTSNTAATITLDVPGQNATYTYSGTAGQYVTLGFGNVATNPSGQQIQVLMYKPDGTQYQSLMSATGASVGMTLPDTGTYTVFMQPYFAGKGAATGSAVVVIDGGSTVSSGAAIDGAITVSGMGATYVANGTAGQGIGWAITNLTLTPSSSTYATYTVYRPDGTVATTGYCYTSASNGNGSCGVNVLAQTSGQYRFVLQPYGGATATFNVWSSPDRTGALTLGSSSGLTFTNPGESARYTFSATAGDVLGLGLTNLVLSPTTTIYADYYVYKPDGTQWFTNYCTTSGDYCSNNMTIPTTGQYTVVVTPRYAATGSVNLIVSKDKTGALTVGTLSNLAVDLPGQNLRYSFNGTAGQSLALNLNSLITSPSGQSYSVTIYRPDTGASWTSWTVTAPGSTQQLAPLPATGAYTVLIEPYYAGKGAATGSVTALVNPGITVPVDGTEQAGSITASGGSARYTFNGTTGQNLGLGLGSVSLTPTTSTSTYVSYRVYKPDGAAWISGSCYSDGNYCATNLANLPSTGLYSIVVQPVNGATGIFKLWLTPDKTGTLTVGTAANLTIDKPGQNLRYTFSGTSGQSLAVNLNSLVTSPSGQSYSATIYRPDTGASWTAWTVNQPGGTQALAPLPATGTYTIFIELYGSGKGAATGSLSVLLNPGITIPIDGSQQSGAVIVTGGSSRYTFNATAGQNLGLGLANVSLTPSTSTYVTYAVYKPDGTPLLTGSCYNDGNYCSGNLSNLPSTGLYSIVVQAVNGATGTFTLRLTLDKTGTLTIGTPAALTIDNPGQNLRYSFNGTSGQSLSIDLGSITTTPSGQSTTVYIYKPDNTPLTSWTFSSTGGSQALPSLPTTGTYNVLIEPYALGKGAATGSWLVNLH